MQHHAYFVTGDMDAGIESARAFGETLGLSGQNNPNIIVLRSPLFSVDEARKLSELASRMPASGERKLIIAAAPRIFHEAQNALLKTFEEPPAGTYLVLIVPSEGVLIQTLRSRLLPLPGLEGVGASAAAKAFLTGKESERGKIIEAILDRAKSDKAEEKQAARAEALSFAEGLMRALSAKRKDPETRAFLSDLNRLVPILHERSAPLKPILEHILITAPR
ncbi:MAG TPA: hypothetical protein VEB18_04195 [Candidatus Paceibacterota bacterium]|nr:hypothetical protein [Candidatus Paceibacterota bacterium]